MSQPENGAAGGPSPILQQKVKVRGHCLRLQLEVDGLPEQLGGVLRFRVPAEIELTTREVGGDSKSKKKASLEAASSGGRGD
eukprot:8172868-Pyramimonas_sp.AAC.1